MTPSRLETLNDLARDVDGARQYLAETRVERDAEILRALRAGTPYAEVGEATDLTRAALAKIRRQQLALDQ